MRSPVKPSAEKPATDKPATDKAAAASDDEQPKKKKAKRLTRQQELDRSLETGTVPARYRSQVPKEYHQYIPFARQ